MTNKHTFEMTKQADARITKLEAQNLILSNGISAVRKLMNNSAGIFGLHLNGDYSRWDELLGWDYFQDRLADFEDAEKVIENENT